jgi:hypothetical protein
VHAYYQNNGVWRGWSCDWQIPCEFHYTDDNYHSYMHLCVTNGAEWFCGWGVRSCITSTRIRPTG